MAKRNRKKKTGPAAGPAAGPTAEPARNDAASDGRSPVVVITLVLTLVAAVGGIWAAYEAQVANTRESRDDSTVTIKEPNVDDKSCAQAFKGKPFILRGDAEMANGASLWEITRGKNDDSLWVGPKANPASPRGPWEIRIPYIGGDGDKGHEYVVMVVSATPNAALLLRDATVPKDGEYKALTKLPEGVRIWAEICVRRAD